MNAGALVLTVSGAGLLLYASAASAKSNIEAGDGGASFDLGNLSDKLETIMNRTTQAATFDDTDTDTAGRNVAAFLGMIRSAEGTDRNGLDPYRVCYGYGHTIGNMRDHPAITGEWRGQRLPDTMCINAGFRPGCVSTAAGAYQIIRPTWVAMRDALKLPDFGPVSQDAAAIELIRRRGALADVRAGRLSDAVHKCRQEWASLPGNTAKQGQRSMGTLSAWFQQNGGVQAA